MTAMIDAESPCRWGGARTPTVAGLMVTIAAVAFALAAVRTLATALAGQNPPSVVALDWTHQVLPALAMATLLVFAVSLLPPRPTWRRGLREPGRLACGVATCFLMASFLGTVSAEVLASLGGTTYLPSPRFGRMLDELSGSLDLWGYLIGLSVLVAWLVLGFVYGWKGQATWVDRAGRAVGLAWLVLAPLGLVLHLVRGIAVLQG